MFTRPYGNSPKIEVSIGGVPIRYESITSFRLLLEEDKHDLLEVSIAGFPPGAVNDFWGKPIKLIIDNGGNMYQEFVGYIDTVKPTNEFQQGLVNYSPFQNATLVCLGASYAMRGSHTKVWSRYKLEDIVAFMSIRYGFSSDCIQKGRIHETLVQTGESDWKFLTRVADIQGLSVNCHGTHLHVYDPYKAFSRRSSFHVIFTLATTKGDPTQTPGQILNFKANFRYVLPYQSSIMTSNGTVLDLHSAERLALPLRTRVGVHDTSFEQGVARIEASRKHTYDHTANVTVMGIAGCVPGGIVKIDGYDALIDDYWYVKCVTHTITSSGFITDLTIARNIDNELVNTNTSVMDIPRDTFFNGNSWVSRRRVSNVYS